MSVKCAVAICSRSKLCSSHVRTAFSIGRFVLFYVNESIIARAQVLEITRLLRQCAQHGTCTSAASAGSHESDAWGHSHNVIIVFTCFEILVQAFVCEVTRRLSLSRSAQSRSEPKQYDSGDTDGDWCLSEDYGRTTITRTVTPPVIDEPCECPNNHTSGLAVRYCCLIGLNLV